MNKAHLEVLKSEDIEDQLLSKKLVDIICSPRHTHRQSNMINMLGDNDV